MRPQATRSRGLKPAQPLGRRRARSETDHTCTNVELAKLSGYFEFTQPARDSSRNRSGGCRLCYRILHEEPGSLKSRQSQRFTRPPNFVITRTSGKRSLCQKDLPRHMLAFNPQVAFRSRLMIGRTRFSAKRSRSWIAPSLNMLFPPHPLPSPLTDDWSR